MPDETLALLAPWASAWDALGRLHQPVQDEGDACVDPHGVLWFRWTPRDSVAAELELLALVAALCRSAPRAFEAWLRGLGDAYTQYFLDHRARYERASALGVYVKIEDHETLVAMDHALRGGPHDRPFGATRQALLRGNDMARVPLWIEFEPRGNVPPKTAIAATLALVETLTDGSPRDERLAAAFRLAAVQLDVYDDAQLDVQTMPQLAALLEAGVRVPFFQFGSPFSLARTPDVVTQTVKTVHALLGPQCVANVDDTARPRVERLEVTTPMPTSLAVSVCTAIAQSKTLAVLEIDHNMTRRFGREQFPMDRCWRWLAYAIFSRDATHTIQTLEVTAEILSEFDAAIIQEVLAREDPLLALIDPRSGIEAPVEDFLVSIPSETEIALVYDYTRARKDIAAFTTPHALVGLRVLQNDTTNGWVSFVLPGWGEARVHRDSVAIEQRSRDSVAQAHPVCHGIPHIRVNYISNEDIDAVCAFLDVVGPHVRRLDIHEFDVEVEDVAAHIVSFARRCPRLEMLDLFAVKIDSIQPLVDAYAHGDYAIKTFKFRQLQVRDMSSMHAFFDTLADPSHPMTRCLRELSFHVFEQTIQDVSRGSILFSCVEMLAENTNLRICRAITMSKRRCTQFASMFQQFDNEPLPARKGPLSLRSKLAFLSVVMGSSAHGTKTAKNETIVNALHRVDTNVLHSIFTFAAENERRQSVVEVPVRKWA